MPEDKMHVGHIITSDYGKGKQKAPTSAQEEEFKSLLGEEEGSSQKAPINLTSNRLLGISALFFDNVEVDLSPIKPLVLKLDNSFDRERLNLIEEKINQIIINNLLTESSKDSQNVSVSDSTNKNVLLTEKSSTAHSTYVPMQALFTEATKNYSQMEVMGEEFNRFVDIIGQQIHSGAISYRIENIEGKIKKIFYSSSNLITNENVKIWSYVIVFLLILLIVYYIVFKV